MQLSSEDALFTSSKCSETIILHDGWKSSQLKLDRRVIDTNIFHRLETYKPNEIPVEDLSQVIQNLETKFKPRNFLI